MQQELLYLGHFISEEGVRPDPSKIESIKNWPVPKTADEVKRFVAFANYYRKHIKDFSRICIPLNQLTRKGVVFEWIPECQQSFEILKTNFVNPPILDYPDFENSFKLQTDASGYALGAVLSNRKNGRPVAYASRALNKSELNYGTIEKELLAVVWAIKHFRPYLYGRKFDLETDHRPLVYLFSMKEPSSRLTKFRLALEEYDFSITYIPGKDNVLADALSRMTSDNLKEINKKVDQDVLVTTRSKSAKENSDGDPNNEMAGQHSLSGLSIEVIFNENKVIPEVRFDAPKHQIKINPAKTLIQLRRIVVMLKEMCKINKINELVIKNTDPGKQFYNMIHTNNLNNGMPPLRIMDQKIKHIESKMEKDLIINDFHLLPTAGHAGIAKTLKNIQRRYFWSTMKKDISNFIKSCESCQKNKHIKPKNVPQIVTTTANSAFSKIYLDLVGPLVPSYEGHSYILTTQCELTKFITATPILNKSTKIVAKAFVENVILNYGVPDEIATDRGTEFMSELFTKICELLKISKLNSTAYHHQSIGALENSHKSLGNF